MSEPRELAHWRLKFKHVESYPIQGQLKDEWCIRITLGGAGELSALAAVGGNIQQAVERMNSFLHIRQLLRDEPEQ